MIIIEKKIEEQINDFMKYVFKDVEGYQETFVLVMPYMDGYITLMKDKNLPFTFYKSAERLAGFTVVEHAAEFATERFVNSSKFKGLDQLLDFVKIIMETQIAIVEHGRTVGLVSPMVDKTLNSIINFESLWVEYQRKMVS